MNLNKNYSIGNITVNTNYNLVIAPKVNNKEFDKIISLKYEILNEHYIKRLLEKSNALTIDLDIRGLYVSVDAQSLSSTVVIEYPKWLAWVKQWAPKDTDYDLLFYREGICEGLAVSLMLLAPEIDILLLHSSAVLMPNGKAIIFPGVSGVGKSTNARFALKLGWKVLADDKTIVQFVDGKPYTIPSPIVSEFRSEELTTDKLYPVEALAFPVKSKSLQIKQLTVHEGFERLLKAVIQHREDKKAAESTIDLGWQVAENTKAFEYHFPKQEDALLTLQKAITE